MKTKKGNLNKADAFMCLNTRYESKSRQVTVSPVFLLWSFRFSLICLGQNQKVAELCCLARNVKSRDRLCLLQPIVWLPDKDERAVQELLPH